MTSYETAETGLERAEGVAAGGHAEVIEIIQPLRRYVRAHARTAQDVDDIVQETLTRLIEVQPRLSPGAALAYSIVVARHVILDLSAASERAGRSHHRLIDLAEPPRPDEELLRSEQRQALAIALADAPEAERTALLEHVLEEKPVTAIASNAEASSGSVAARLARTRAHLRLDYILALRNIQLPTPRCRPVLLALSAGDTRRQNALRAGHHLLACPTCSAVSEPLLQRRSALAAILPWLGVGPALALLRHLARNTPRSVSVTAGSVAAGTLATAALLTATQVAPRVVPPDPAAVTPASSSASPSTAPSASPSPVAAQPGRLVRLSNGSDLLAEPARLGTAAGESVRADAVPVLSVVADEGFWIGRSGNAEVFVELSHTGRESPVTVKAGDLISFTGTVVDHGPSFARQVGVSDAEGARRLTSQGAHIKVNEHGVSLK